MEKAQQGKPCNPLRQWKSIKAAYQKKRKKGAVMVEGLCPQSVPIKSVNNTKLVATKHQKCPEDKGNKTRIPRIEIKRKRVRNRPLPCQMPCSDRGIYEVKNKQSHRLYTIYNLQGINQRAAALGWWVGRRNREEN